jgi:hypothetical protein
MNKDYKQAVDERCKEAEQEKNNTRLAWRVVWKLLAP